MQDIVNWATIVGTILTIIGLGITLWEVTRLKRQVRQSSEEAKERLLGTLAMINATDLIRQVELLKRDLLDSRWECAFLRMQELHKLLFEIKENKELKGVIRTNFDIPIQRIPSDLSYLEGLVTEREDNPDIRFITSNLQKIQDCLKLIEIHYKRK